MTLKDGGHVQIQ